MGVKVEVQTANMPYNTYKEMMQGIADKTGFSFSKLSLKVTGEKNGFKVSVVKHPSGRIAIMMSVGMNGFGPTEEVLRAAHGVAKDVAIIEPQGERIAFLLKIGTKRTQVKRAVRAINELTEFFAGIGYVDTTDIEIVPAVTTYTKKEPAEVKENAFLGTIGAILGSVVGIGLIFGIAQVGLIAGIGGTVLAVGTLMGYETLAKKLSKKGIIICVIIMIIATYVADHMVWVAEVEKALSTNGDVDPIAVTIFLHPILAMAGATGEFIKDLVVLYIFTALGAVPKIKRRLYTLSESMA
jgi:hypothetical protein